MRILRPITTLPTAVFLVACGGSSIPEPADLAQTDVKPGSGELTVKHQDETIAFNHVKAIKRTNDDGEPRVLVVFSQEEIDSADLADPFDAFDSRRWAVANHPVIRPVITVELDPDNLEHPKACDTLAEPEWLQGGCGIYESTVELTITDDSVSGSVAMLDFFGMKYEDRGWEANGSFEAPLASVGTLEPVMGQHAVDSPQVDRLEALGDATASGDLEAIRSHVTPDAFAELNEAIEAWGEKEVLGMMATMDDAFVNLDVNDPTVQVMLYNAGKRSRLILKKEEEGMTSSEINDFQWIDGQWLVSM